MVLSISYILPLAWRLACHRSVPTLAPREHQENADPMDTFYAFRYILQERLGIMRYDGNKEIRKQRRPEYQAAVSSNELGQHEVFSTTVAVPNQLKDFARHSRRITPRQHFVHSSQGSSAVLCG